MYRLPLSVLQALHAIVMVMASQYEINAICLLGADDVVGQAHVCQGYNNFCPLLLQHTILL